MARTARQTLIAANQADEMPAAIADDLNAAAQLPALQAAVSEHQDVILKQYGDGQPYERTRYIDRCRYHMARSAEEALEVGRCLIVMKECEGHGAWTPLLEEIGVEERLARRMMQTALRFSNRALTPALLEAAQTKTKLFELLVLDDAEMAALNDGETVRGLQLDDVERMSVSELRRAMRQSRADKEAEAAAAQAAVAGQLAAKDRLIADSKKRIAELVEEKNRWEAMTDSERDAELERDLLEASLQATAATLPLRKAVDAIRAIDHHSQGLYVAMQGALHRVLAEVESIAADYCISLDTGLPGLDDDLADLDDPNAGEDFGAEPLVQ